MCLTFPTQNRRFPFCSLAMILARARAKFPSTSSCTFSYVALIWAINKFSRTTITVNRKARYMTIENHLGRERGNLIQSSWGKAR